MTPYPRIKGKVLYDGFIEIFIKGGVKPLALAMGRFSDCKHYNLVVTDHNGAGVYTK